MLTPFFKQLNYQLARTLNTDARNMNSQIIYGLTIPCYIWVTCYTLRYQYTIITVCSFLQCTLHHHDIHCNEEWIDHFDDYKGVDLLFPLFWPLPIYLHFIPIFWKSTYFSIPAQHGLGGNNHIAVFSNTAGEGTDQMK